MNTALTKILVVDDSALFRQSILNILHELTYAIVVGVAKNGLEALEKIEKLDPDVLTLDVQMPDMNGIQVLREIKRRRLRAKSIIVSSLTSEGAQVTTDALMEGAFDFILKPTGTDLAANRRHLKSALDEKLSALREAFSPPKLGNHRTRRTAPDDLRETPPALDVACRAVILGTSTGGPEALKIVLPKLPATLPVPVLVVQHMPAHYTRSLAARLNEICELDVVEAQDRIEAIAGRVIVARGSQQMKLESAGEGLVVRVTDDPPDHGIRPSIDYLLRSVADVLCGQALAVIMTGMGRDGLDGCRRLKLAGGYVFSQDRHDCVVYGMPKAVIAEGLADRILSLGMIAPAIVGHLKCSRRHGS